MLGPILVFVLAWNTHERANEINLNQSNLFLFTFPFSLKRVPNLLQKKGNKSTESLLFVSNRLSRLSGNHMSGYFFGLGINSKCNATFIGTKTTVTEYLDTLEFTLAQKLPHLSLEKMVHLISTCLCLLYFGSMHYAPSVQPLLANSKTKKGKT